MATPTFYWHDYETFGRVPRRDRPAQFAGLRTDADLNELEPGANWYCQPAPDSLPDPESVLLTGITPQLALERGVPEYEFAALIEAQLAREGTVGVGYNSIRFDDEVTRHLFWRNLIDPYAREWQNGCGRWDLLDTVRCAWALRPEGLVWPTGADGKPSFRLELLTAANGVAHEAAHDALSDVRATVAVARLVKSAQPALWDFCLKLRRKEAVQSEMGFNRPFVHLSGMYGVERGCAAIVWPLAPHPTNKNEVIVWDLSADPSELESLDVETARRRMFTRADSLLEGETRLPIKTIHINKSPVVIGNLKTLGGAVQRFNIDVPQAMQHAERAAALPRLDALWGDVFKRPEGETTPDVDEDLYGGFVNNEDRRTLNRLLQLKPDQLASKQPAFADVRLQEVFFRYRARNFTQTLNEAEHERWEQHRAARLHQGAGGGQTLESYLERIDSLAQAADERGDERASALLEALVDYAEGIAPDR